MGVGAETRGGGGAAILPLPLSLVEESRHVPIIGKQSKNREGKPGYLKGSIKDLAKG